MKLIGIDYGEKKVGIAISDERGVMAFPRATFPNDRALLSSVTGFVLKEKPERVIIGESKNNRGEDNPIMESARRFAKDIERESGVPVFFEPEFYTSAEARRLKEQAGGASHTVDAEAAAIILMSYIERNKHYASLS